MKPAGRRPREALTPSRCWNGGGGPKSTAQRLPALLPHDAEWRYARRRVQILSPKTVALFSLNYLLDNLACAAVQAEQRDVWAAPRTAPPSVPPPASAAKEQVIRAPSISRPPPMLESRAAAASVSTAHRLTALLPHDAEWRHARRRRRSSAPRQSRCSSLNYLPEVPGGRRHGAAPGCSGRKSRPCRGRLFVSAAGSMLDVKAETRLARLRLANISGAVLLRPPFAPDRSGGEEP